jgi:hypothetical protein
MRRGAVTDVLRSYVFLPYAVGGIFVLLLMILGTLANILYTLRDLRDGQIVALATRPDTDPGVAAGSARGD